MKLSNILIFLLAFFVTINGSPSHFDHKLFDYDFDGGIFAINVTGLGKTYLFMNDVIKSKSGVELTDVSSISKMFCFSFKY